MIRRRSVLPYVLLAAGLLYGGTRPAVLQHIRPLIRGGPATGATQYRAVRAYRLAAGETLAVTVPPMNPNLRLKSWALLPERPVGLPASQGLAYSLSLRIEPPEGPPEERHWWFRTRWPEPEPDGSPRRFVHDPDRLLAPPRSIQLRAEPGSRIRLTLDPAWRLAPGETGEPIPLEPALLCMLYSAPEPAEGGPGRWLAGLRGSELGRLFRAAVFSDRADLRSEPDLVAPLRFARLPVLREQGLRSTTQEFYTLRSPPEVPTEGAAVVQRLEPHRPVLWDHSSGAQARLTLLQPREARLGLTWADLEGGIREEELDLTAGVDRTLRAGPPGSLSIHLPPDGDGEIWIALGGVDGAESGFQPPRRTASRLFRQDRAPLRFDLAGAAGHGAPEYRLSLRSEDREPRLVSAQVWTPSGARLQDYRIELAHPGGPSLSRLAETGGFVSEASYRYLRVPGRARLTVSSDRPVLVGLAVRASLRTLVDRVPRILRPGMRLRPPGMERGNHWLPVRPLDPIDAETEAVVRDLPQAELQPRPEGGSRPQFQGLQVEGSPSRRLILEPRDETEGVNHTGGLRWELPRTGLMVTRGARYAEGLVLVSPGDERRGTLRLTWGDREETIRLRRSTNRFRIRAPREQALMAWSIEGIQADRVSVHLDPAGAEPTGEVRSSQIRGLARLRPGQEITFPAYLTPPESLTLVTYGGPRGAAELDRMLVRVEPPPGVRTDQAFHLPPILEREIHLAGPLRSPLLPVLWRSRGLRRAATLSLPVSDSFLPGLFRIRVQNPGERSVWVRLIRRITDRLPRRLGRLGARRRLAVNLASGERASVHWAGGATGRIRHQRLEANGPGTSSTRTLPRGGELILAGGDRSVTHLLSLAPGSPPVDVLLEEPSAPERSGNTRRSTYHEIGSEGLRFAPAPDQTTELVLVRLRLRALRNGPQRLRILGACAGQTGSASYNWEPEFDGLTVDLRENRVISRARDVFVRVEPGRELVLQSEPPMLAAAAVREPGRFEGLYRPGPTEGDRGQPLPRVQRSGPDFSPLEPLDEEWLTELGREAVVELQRPWFRPPAEDSAEAYTSVIPLGSNPSVRFLEEPVQGERRIASDGSGASSLANLYRIPPDRPVEVSAATARLSGVVLVPPERLGRSISFRLDDRRVLHLDLDWPETPFLAELPGPGRYRLEVVGAEGADLRVLTNLRPLDRDRPDRALRRAFRLEPGASLELAPRLRLPALLTALVYPAPNQPERHTEPLELLVRLDGLQGIRCGRPVSALPDPERIVRIAPGSKHPVIPLHPGTLELLEPVRFPIPVPEAIDPEGVRVTVTNRAEIPVYLRFISRDVPERGAPPEPEDQP